MTAREKFNHRARMQAIKRMVAIAHAEKEPTVKGRRSPAPRRREAETVAVPPSGWVSIRDFSQLNHISETSLYNAVNKGRLSSVKIGKCRYINPAEYERHRELSNANRAEAAQRAIEARKRHAAARREGNHAEVS